MAAKKSSSSKKRSSRPSRTEGKPSARASSATKAVGKKGATTRPVVYSDLYFALNELWHAIRQLNALEESVCTLREEARTAHEVDAVFIRDLRRTLKLMPARELFDAAQALSSQTSRKASRSLFQRATSLAPPQ